MRAIVLLYGVISYFLFFVVFLYFIAFVGDFFVPKTLSTGAGIASEQAFVVNLGLMLLWGIQHSVMARGWFKDAISSFVPHHVERSTYVLATSIVLIVLMLYWQPMSGVVWQVENSVLQTLLWTIFATGWVLVLLSTFLTDHFDLFGLRQSWLYFVKKTYTDIAFTEVWVYQWIRHPMMLGLLMSFWALPTMTVSHLVFSIGMSIYVLAGIYFEEQGLAQTLGKDYIDYQARTSKVIPKIY